MNRIMILMMMVIMMLPAGFAYNWTNTTVDGGGSYIFDLIANGCTCDTEEMIYVECRTPNINNTINQTSLYMTNFWAKYEKCLLEVSSFDKDEDRCVEEFSDLGAEGCYDAAQSLDAKLYGKTIDILEMNKTHGESEARLEQDRETEVSAKNTRIKDLEESLGKCGQDKDDEIANVQSEASTQRIVWGVGGVLLGVVGYSQYRKKKEKDEGRRSGGLPKPFI